MYDDRRTGAADVVGHADLRVHLPGPGIAAELGDHLADLLDAGRADRVAAGLQAAARVHRYIPVESRHPFGGESSCLALLAEPEILDSADLGYREAVVDLDEVDVLLGEARLGKRPFACGDGGIQGGYVPPVVECDGVARLGACEHPHRRVGELAGALERHHHDRRRTVGDRRAIEEPQGIGDHR